jgi:hypothetical protein
MSGGRGSIKDLLDCLRAARGDAAKMRMCEQEFLDAGGRMETWRIFIDRDGEAIAVDDGKVYACRYLFDLTRS